MPVLGDATALRVGTRPAAAAYAGEAKVWPSKWTPAALPGLAIWLDASALGLGDGAPVDPWPNLGTGGPGTMVGTPAPKVRAGALNGLPVVRFTAAEGRLRMVGTGITTDYTVAYVSRPPTTASLSSRYLCATYDPGNQINMLLGYYGATEDVAYDHLTAFWEPNVGRAATTAWRLYSADAASVAGGNPRLFRGGVLMSTGATLGSGWGQTLNIAGYSATGVDEAGDAEIAELCFYDRKLPDADRQTLENYLLAKWGL